MPANTNCSAALCWRLASSWSTVPISPTPKPPKADPADTLNRLIDALVDVTLANRESGGLYRWQARYLHSEDQSTLGDQLRLVNRRIQRPLIAIRPTLTTSQRWMLSAGLLSVIGSAVDHRVQLPTDEMRALLSGAASAVSQR